MREVIKGVAARFAGAAARALDEVATIAVSRDTLRINARKRQSSRLHRIFQFSEEWASVSADFQFSHPQAISPSITQSPLGHLDAHWKSEYSPFFPQLEPFFRETALNQTAAVRCSGLDPRRPTIILLHGYLTGQYALERRIWPLDWLQNLGFNTILFTLPFHGVRLGKGEERLFPSQDPRANIEGLRQAVFDLGNWVRWLRFSGHSRVGIAGMSLGSYVAALFATLDGDLDFLVPWVPLASFADFALEQHQLGDDLDSRGRAHRTLEQVYARVSPLERPPLIQKGRTLVIGARADRITPITHAQRLARHFQAPLHSVSGGHLLQLGRTEGFRVMGEFLKGAISP